MSVTFLDQSSLMSLTRPLVEIYVTDLLILSLIRKLLTNYQDAESLKWRNDQRQKHQVIYRLQFSQVLSP